MQEFINSMVRHLKNSDHNGRAAANSTFAPDSDQSANVFSPQTVSGHFKTSQPLTNNHSHVLKKQNEYPHYNHTYSGGHHCLAFNCSVFYEKGALCKT